MRATPKTCIALDLETTGLDPRQDEIIEVGATKFCGDEVLATFQSLVKPRRLVPYSVQLLTGITNQDLQDAPPFAVVAADLLRFLGDHPLVAQNAPFDLKFLAEQGLQLQNPVYDTLDMAKILVPTLTERNLTALTSYFGVPYPVKHRALPDAQAAKDVFLALQARAHALDPRVLGPLCNLGADTGWALAGFFQDVLLEKLTRAPSSPLPSDFPVSQLRTVAAIPSDVAPQEEEHPHPASEVEKVEGALDVDRLTWFLGPGGPLATALPSFEHRPEQIAMTQTVAEALNDQAHLIAEAGTGTGKSLAYLLPALCYAIQNDTKVVISTNTINLQEQIVSKDIPLLLQALEHVSQEDPPAGLPKPEQVRVAQLKGRGNYLCPRRWSAVLSGASAEMEPSLLARIAVWLATTQTGDRAELNLNNTEQAAWSRISAQTQNCPTDQCMALRGGQCFLQKARRRAAEAHLLVVNHALLLSDLSSGSNVLPEYEFLVVDEAHHLEDVATEQLGFRTGYREFQDFLDRLSQDVGGRRRQGFLSALEAALRSGGPLFATQHGLLEHLATAQTLVAEAGPLVAGFFTTLSEYVRQHGEGSAEYGRRVRLTGGARRQPFWAQVEQGWDDTRRALESIQRSLALVHTGLEALGSSQLKDYDDLIAEAAALQFTVQELLDQGNAVIAQPDPEWVCWLATVGQHEGVGLFAAPIEVGPVLQRELFSKKASVVLTSATLRTGGDFQYIKGRLGLEDPREVALDSPFSYRDAALVLVPRDAPEPQRPGGARVLEEALAELCAASQGRALALFTSHASLQSAYRTLTQVLEPQGIRVLAQGVSGSTHQLLQRLRTEPNTVLLGTSSFWEGVDVVGEALSLLVIARLPFTVPTEPVFAARSELFEEPFREYAVPQAVLRFRQGFGRLIRSKTDRGVAVVLDPRVSSKNYGGAFLESLPAATFKPCLLRETPKLTAQWLEQ